MTARWNKSIVGCRSVILLCCERNTLFT